MAVLKIEELLNSLPTRFFRLEQFGLVGRRDEMEDLESTDPRVWSCFIFVFFGTNCSPLQLQILYTTWQ